MYKVDYQIQMCTKVQMCTKAQICTEAQMCPNYTKQLYLQTLAVGHRELGDNQVMSDKPVSLFLFFDLQWTGYNVSGNQSAASSDAAAVC